MREYLDTVGAEIQWKAARTVVLKELQDHLEDQAAASVAEGVEEDQAKQDAVASMGDPVEVGKALDAVHRPKSLKAFFLPVAAVLTISLLMWLFVFFDSDDPVHWIWLPLASTAAGVIAMALLIHIRWNRILPHLWKLVFPGWIVLMFLAKAYYPSMSSRWSEYCAMLTPLVYCSVVYGCRGKGLKGLLCSGAVLVFLFWVMKWFLGSPLGALCLFAVGAVLLFDTAASGSFGKKRTAYSLAAVILVVVLVLFFIDIAYEILWWRNVLSEYEHLYRAVLQHSRLLGAGEAFRLERYDLMQTISPYALDEIMIVGEGDFFLASVIYRFGWIFGVCLAAVVVVFFVSVLRIGLRQANVWSRFLTIAIIVPMLLQAVLHVVNNCLVFCISSQLPLLSYGNTHRIVDLCLLGLVFSTFRMRTILRDTPVKSPT